MRFGILGPLAVWREDEHQLDLGTPKARVLVAVLLSRAGHPVSEDQLAVALWGDTPPKSATKNVQTYVHRLRRQLGDPARVVRQGAGYLVPVDRDELDAATFEHLADAGRAPEAAAAQFTGLRAVGRLLDARRGATVD
ncbi:AfsR/SARP family transcriptional regulator [Amycolatopsis magusensis]|uniref:AfsR/SARP family transcriptional regulator n=1 Tax=Amycolatopsis magusensis TaxID=882444 RepID=UPI0037B13B9A